jgi:uncharacterized protein YdaT
VDCAGRSPAIAMPWNADVYPVSMKNLPARVRAKAIQVANALLASGHPEGQAIRIAIAQARAWARAHPQTTGFHREASTP